MPRVTGERFADKQTGFIWLPREKNIVYSVYINGTQETDFFSAQFTRAIFPEIGSFKIDLVNASGYYTDRYSQGQEVYFEIDLEGSGPTTRFKGSIDTIKNVYDGSRGYVLTLEGGHKSSSNLLTTHVTEEYTATLTCDEIFKDLVDNYLTGYTYTNVAASTVKPTIKWENKPLVDCFYDLCKLAEFDSYCDDDLDFHFFKKKSIHNSNEAIVWNDTMISTSGLSIKSLDTRNWIQVVGDDGTGLPVISTLEDSTSQADYGKKEQIITDTAITTQTQADELAQATLELKKTPELEGKATALILPSIAPGETIYIVDPTMKLRDKYKIAKYTHTFPNITTECTIYKKRTLPSLFKERIEKELALTEVKNPYKMTESVNITFDDLSQISTKDSNVTVTDGKLKLESGTEGVTTSITFNKTTEVTQCQLKVVGEQFTSTIFRISTDGGENYQEITPNDLTNLENTGTSIVLQIRIYSASTEIDSIALLTR